MYAQSFSALPSVNCMWHAVATYDGAYTDTANEYWSFGFVKYTDGSFLAELYGPTLVPRTLHGHKGEEYWGVEFKAHVTLAATDKGGILNTHIILPVQGASFEIAGRQYAIPGYDELESFVGQLEKDGVIAADPRLQRALLGDEAGFSQRSRQRHFKQITGLTKKQIEQLQRARHAYYLLQSGNSPAEAALAAGYADQPHMTRSLKVLRGETPAQIIDGFIQ